ncbi:sugar phosphate isomerase/epimerase family protein [Lysinibacillus xylanilyticus]|uniref:sugar phosphate isomerase/epimerase family protein n=1 Tax=Lysinibacillus xylanilyticus TaxID=582475 RepID=UPI003CFCD705
MIGISQISLEELNFYSAMELLKEKKFNNVGLFYKSIKNEDINTVKMTLRHLGINPINLSAAGIGARSYTAWVEDVLKAIDIAGSLGIKDLIVIASPMGCDTKETSLRHLRKGIKEVLPFAEERNVRLLIEPLHPIMINYSVLTNMKESLSFIEEFNPSQVGLVLDLFHQWWDDNLAECLPLIIPYIGCVQLSDWNGGASNPLERNLFGEGIIPISSYIDLLTKNDYRGLFEIEIISDSWKDDRSKMLNIISEELANIKELIFVLSENK